MSPPVPHRTSEGDVVSRDFDGCCDQRLGNGCTCPCHDGPRPMTDDDPGRVLSTVEDPTPRTEPLREHQCPGCEGQPMSPDCGLCGGAGTLPDATPVVRAILAERATHQEAAPEPLREALAAAIHDRNIDSDANGCDHHADEYGTSLQCADEADSLLAHPSLRAAPSQAPDQGPARDTGGLRDGLEAMGYDEPSIQRIVTDFASRRRLQWSDDDISDLSDILSQGAAHEERGLDVERLARSIPTADLREWFQRIHVRGDGTSALQESRALAAFIAEMYAATPEAAPEEGPCRGKSDDRWLCAVHEGGYMTTNGRCALAPSAEREIAGSPHDVRGHFPFHGYPHPDDHSHEVADPGEYAASMGELLAAKPYEWLAEYSGDKGWYEAMNFIRAAQARPLPDARLAATPEAAPGEGQP